MSDPVSIPASASAPLPGDAFRLRLYSAIWRWHFFAGLFVAPVLVMLALTGLVMMVYAHQSNEMGWVPDLRGTGPVQPVSAMAQAAAAAVPDGRLLTYIAPQSAQRPAFFELTQGETPWIVAVDPHTAQVLSSQDGSRRVLAIAESLHGTLLIGDLGDRIIEMAASLGVILIVTGAYLWWPRDGRGLARALVPDFSAAGRGVWREIHKAIGLWTSVLLLLFLLTGLAWTGVWGDQWVKPWSAFPADKWEKLPVSDLTHASLNHQALHEVPWALEAAPLPASGSLQGQPAVRQPVSLDNVVQWAASQGFKGQLKVSLPAGEQGVYTVACDARNQDGVLPSGDRYVHIDRYTGHVLASVGYEQYGFVGKLMAWGIALHKGLAGTANFVFNLIYLALTLLLAVSGVVMWWKRRPAGALGAPRYPAGWRLTAGVAVIALALGLLFPLGGLAIVSFAAFEVVTTYWRKRPAPASV